MSYGVRLTDHDVSIPREKLGEALECLKRLAREGRTYGASYSGILQWLALTTAMPEDSFRGVLRVWGYTWTAGTSAVRLEDRVRSDWGDDRALWYALSPVISPGSVLEWRGEDENMWRYSFSADGLREESAEIVWTDMGDSPCGPA